MFVQIFDGVIRLIRIYICICTFRVILIHAGIVDSCVTSVVTRVNMISLLNRLRRSSV